MSIDEIRKRHEAVSSAFKKRGYSYEPPEPGWQEHAHKDRGVLLKQYDLHVDVIKQYQVKVAELGNLNRKKACELSEKWLEAKQRIARLETELLSERRRCISDECEKEYQSDVKYLQQRIAGLEAWQREACEEMSSSQLNAVFVRTEKALISKVEVSDA